jgi:ribose 5-phosphate isomerase B
MLIAIASDHAGFAYKQRIIAFLREHGHKVRDFGTSSAEPCDYPLFIRPAAQAVASGECERGIVLGGSGNGEAIVANRVVGVRCAYCFNHDTARLGREHNNANCISIGERMVSIEMALEIVSIFLETPFAGDRHARRIALIDKPEDDR